MNIYETDRLLAEYLLFHYGTPEEVLPYPHGPQEALGYPVRCVREFLREPWSGRALDLGCAVGRSTFELAQHSEEVVGIDFSRRFIKAAERLAQGEAVPYRRLDEGDRTTELLARAPRVAGRVRFEVGDATALRTDLGSFQVVLMANLIDRLADPERCLAQLPELVAPGGDLIVTSPYTWLEEFTPRDRWLRLPTLEGLRDVLAPAFELLEVRDLPFLIREHARKFQWSVAQGSHWRRKS